jgi:hypothetical protein
LLQFLRLRSQKILAFKLDGPASNACITGKKPHKRSSKRAFSGSGFAEDTHDFAWHEAKTDTD